MVDYEGKQTKIMDAYYVNVLCLVTEDTKRNRMSAFEHRCLAAAQQCTCL